MFHPPVEAFTLTLACAAVVGSRPAPFLCYNCLVAPLVTIRLLGGLSVETAAGTVHRFRSQKVAALLAYLALNTGRACSRERLCDLLWPDTDLEIARPRLRITLSSLRKQIEPPEVPFGAVLDVSVSGTVRLRAEAVTTDVALLQNALRRRDKTQTAALAAGGELLPTFYDDWVLTERERLAAALEFADQNDVGESETTPSARAEMPAASPEYVRRVPVYLTRFLGRETEEARLAELLAAPSARLVTLVGGGGHGKTRLSVEMARRWTGGPVWFIGLADLWNGERLAPTILRALDLTPAPLTEAPAQTAQFLQAQPRPLLILDNLEQIAARAAGAVAALLEAAPNLTILATSRSRLDLPGEQSVEILPLRLPEAAETDPARLAAAPGVGLFVNRAQEIRPDFQITAFNAAAVAALCRLLEGIPLAIELAAARIAVLSPARMHERLQAHWDSLPAVGKRASKEDRHRSLRATIEWSVSLLPPDQRRLFVLLSVFPGGATQDAIEAVCETPFALDSLARLRACSLVQVRDENGESRFTVLEVLRQWAGEQISDDEREALAERHARWFTDWATAQWRHFFGPGERGATRALSADDANLHAALEHHLANRDAVAAFRLLQVLVDHWQWEARLPELAQAAEHILALPRPAPTDAVFDTLSGLAIILFSLGDRETAFALADEVSAMARANNDIRWRALALSQQGFLLQITQQVEAAEPPLREALAMVEPGGDPLVRARVLQRVGMFRARYRGDYPAGYALLSEAAALVRGVGDQRSLSAVLYNIATNLMDEQRYRESLPLLSEALTLATATGDRWMQLYCHISLAGGALGVEDDKRARAELEAALPLCQRTGDVAILAPLLLHLFLVLKGDENWHFAAQVLGAAETVCEIVHRPRDADIPDQIACLKAALGEKQFARDYAHGLSLSPPAILGLVETIFRGRVGKRRS